MMPASLLVALLIGGTLLQDGSRAPAPSEPHRRGATADANTVAPVVVEGRRLTPEQREQSVSAFVRSLSAPTRRDRLARWNRRVCPGVVGLPARQGQFIVERMAQEARALNLEVGGPGCTPNILVLASSEPEQAARRLRQKHPKYFAAGSGQGQLATGGGGQSIQTFVSTPRAVRWWHVAEMVGADGQPISFIEVPDPALPEGASGIAVPLVQGTISSRLTSMVREDLTRAVLIVDMKRVRGVSYEALASYLSMAALAQLDPQGERGDLSSVMSLFGPEGRNPQAPGTLTRWDRAYLRGLYAAPANARSLHAQRGAIRRSLLQAAAGE